MNCYKSVCMLVIFGLVLACTIADSDKHMHRLKRSKRETLELRPGEETASFWNLQAQETIAQKLLVKPNTNIAKNVIMFLGDGMSIPTLMASRVWMAQKEGKPRGEENVLSFEAFPYTGLSKTYCVDKQVADSACSATAYLCGVKANEGTIGVTAQVALGACADSENPSTHVTSIARWSQYAGKRTGFVTTTRVTHASPAGTYASTAHRDWESDRDVVGAGFDTKNCPDIAHQLIYGDTGRRLNVMFGGGRRMFYKKSEQDPEGQQGNRTDGRNLVEEWKSELKRRRLDGKYVWNREQLLDVPDDTDHVLGLFQSDHCQYEMERDKETDPSLTEMMEKAIRLLKKKSGSRGFFLFVEGGRIDHAHHDAKAKKALDETLELQKAVKRALEMTSRMDTLIVVTSDHAHTMSVAGYPWRGNDILGFGENADDGLPYPTLSYANGPGYRMLQNGSRADLRQDDMKSNNYEFPSMAPLEQETHGGDDVGVFAIGPWAHLFTGVMEQNVIAHTMAFASCVGRGATACDITFHKETYCVDYQVPDSACTATAYLTGVKANEGTAGVTAEVERGNCNQWQNHDTHVRSVAYHSQRAGKRTGVVTTTRITHASPSGVYAHIAERDWENDNEIRAAGYDPKQCPDIAQQLIYGDTGTRMNVMLGGGRKHFYKTTEVDEEGGKGKRSDENLVASFKMLKAGVKAEYVWNRDQLLAVPDDTEYVLGLFENDHCQYEMERNNLTDPSLTEMTETAIRLLQNNGDKGFFLFVEGGRIDHAHHDSLAKKALDETLEFSRAIQRAKDLTSDEDTLIVVTSDHAHTLSVAGYPLRGSNILGIADMADDDLPYPTLSYANGVGGPAKGESRRDISNDDMSDNNYVFPSMANINSETHGGDDVGIFATGPWAHLLTGSIEQNVIPHVMMYASCVGAGSTACQ